MEEKESKQEHHIIPKYRCKELDINPNFSDNLIHLTRLEHILIHKWMYFKLEDDVYDLLEDKGVDLEGLQMPNSIEFVKKHIPFGNVNDNVGANRLNQYGQVDIDISGKNNPAYIDGRTIGERWWVTYSQRPEQKAKKKKYNRKYKALQRKKTSGN